MKTALRSLLACSTLAGLSLTPVLALAEDVKAAETAADHASLAKKYRDEAAQYRKTAEEHKQMAEMYSKAHPDGKGGGRNPWNAKMHKHCEMLAKDADKLAADADKAAEFHELRAKEIEGK